MKKILAILGAITLSSATVGAVVSCGLGGKDWHVINVGIVNNGKDKSEVASMNKAREKFNEIYGDLGYKIEFSEWIDENAIPKRIQDSSNDLDIPDVFFPTVDMTSQLASGGVILALEGKNSPWGEKGASILENLRYNIDGQKESQDILNRMNAAIDSGRDITNEEATIEQEWDHFLPYAVEASKFQSINLKSPDDKPVQYGITKHVGVGGGSAIINNTVGKFDQMYADLGLIPEDPSQWRKPEGGSFNWNADAKVSIDKLVNYMLNVSKDKQIYTLVDRGMWWMYPLYANAIPDLKDSTKVKELAAAQIGVNWLNGSYTDDDGNNIIPDSRNIGGKTIKYSSIFGNDLYKTSTTEIVKKWFELYGAMVMNAKHDLENDPDYPEKHHEQVTVKWNYQNLFDTAQNNQVQANLVNRGYAAGVNYEPGSYFDMLEGFKLFSNMDYTPLGKIEIFDHETEKTTADKYIDAGLNTWLTPAGSGQAVFNKNLINPRVDPKMEKAEAAMRFVETTFGFYKDGPDGNIIGHGDGGIRNLKDQFASAGDNPVQLAILDVRNQDDKFAEAMQKKVKIKFNRAKDEITAWRNAVIGKKEMEDQEKEAILRLEVTSIQLASDLYRKGAVGLSLAPNRSAFDEAGPLDYHGKTAMQTALLATLGKGKLGDWTWDTLKQQSDVFTKMLMDSLARQDINKSNAES